MTDHKPQIFIGSSTSGYAIAEKVKKCLSAVGDCHLWKDDGVWEVNTSTFDNLLRMVKFFDFGVFVATADDLTLTTDGKIVIEPRDNVILEMALYLGALGKDKSFLLVEKDIKLPTDFSGIYMPRFTAIDDVSIENACWEFINKINEHYRLGHLSLYPTTALAIGYYKNFIEGMVESIHEAENLEYEGATFTDFKLKVIIPNDLSGYIRQKAALFYKRHGFGENAIKTKYRRQPAWFHLDINNAPHAVIYDMPSTLTGIDDAIEMVLQKGFTGRTAMQEIIEQRELNNFRRVLQIQIDKSPYAKEVVEIIDEF
ncbi:STING domain-containing protein [Mucilaginibacter sp. R-33]|uniref:STING domain-containing protein n=1 Tax=Mucilaginibacter sp. R-33 TaxID=3416711 RepID=UPI003CEFC448